MPKDFCVSENVKKLVDSIILKHTLDPIEDVKYTLASESGDGYSSQAIAATITTSSGIHELFLKCMLCIKPTEAMPIDKAFANEVLFYNIIYPEYSRFLKDRYVDDGFRNAPKCFGTWQEDIIAIENLKKKGYRLFNCREEIMNESHITMILKSFAKFHAISFAFKDQEREKYDKFVEKCHDLLHDEKGNSMITKMFGGGIKDFLANLDPIEDSEILSRCKFEDLMASISNSRNTSDYLVLSKGDCWSNNMLFLYESLLPQRPPLFTPHALIVNESNTLVVVMGTKGVLVVQLPPRCPPYGAFGNNKELIYCSSFSLHERILAFSNTVEVRQVRFHPASLQDCHILMLTSDNFLRLHKIENGVETAVGTYQVGVQPMGRFPATKISFLEAFGDVAVDFDFAPPELRTSELLAEKIVPKKTSSSSDSMITKSLKDLSITYNKLATDALSSTKIYPKRVTFDDEPKPIRKQSIPEQNVDWPVLILYGNGDVYTTSIDLKSGNTPTGFKGPLPFLPEVEGEFGEDFCSILCLHSTPPIVCVANCCGLLYHTVLLPIDEDFDFTPEEHRPNFIENPDKALYIFERVELELGLSTNEEEAAYNCRILLHKNVGKLGHYFASHETGIHSIDIACIDYLHKFVAKQNDDPPQPDLFDLSSSVEYLVCTKMAASEKVNPVIGFTVYYNPPTILTLLANGQLVTLALAALFTIPTPDVLEPENMHIMNSPLKKMLSEPFDIIIQRILKQSTAQPILKMSSAGTEHTPQECYELLQRAAQVFREEHFKNHTKAREEIEKRMKTLIKLKEIQKADIEKIAKEKQKLQEKAEALAEKYEDIKDKQEEMSKRCEKLLILIAKKRAEPSNAEKDFMKELKEGESKVETYKNAIVKIKTTIKYQELQMKNWHSQIEKENTMGNVQMDAIKSNLHDTTEKIASMVNEINQYKKQLNLK